MSAEEQKTRFLKNEIAAFESRLTGIKAELESLRKQKEVIQGEIEGMRARHNTDIEARHAEARRVQTLAEESRRKLESDKKEFEIVLQKFQQDRVGLDRERQAAAEVKADAQKTLDRVGVFIRQVRDGAQTL